MDFLVWYYTTAWREVVRAWQNFLRFWWYYFSVPWLLRTLPTPWHRDVTPYGRGFDIREFARTLVNNLVSRVLGLIIRSAAVLLWLFLELTTLGAGIFFVILWPLVMPVIALGFILGIYALLRADTPAPLVTMMPVVLAGLLLRRAYRHRKRMEFRGLGEKEISREYPNLWGNVLRRLGYRDNPSDFFDKRAEFLAAENLTDDDFQTVFRYEVEKAAAREERHRFWDPARLFSVPPLGRSWVYGYTVNLDRIGRELGREKIVSLHPNELAAYASEIKTLETVLSRSRQANALVVGEPGVGRETVVEAFAELLGQGRLANVISHKRLIELNAQAVGSAAALAHVLGEAAYAGNVILVLPAFEQYLTYAEALVPYLRSPAIQIIALTSFEALHDLIERSPEVLSHFEKVEVHEPDAAKTLRILLDFFESFEKRTGVFVPYPALKALVEKADRYIQDAPFPKKAIDLLDRTATVAAERGEKEVGVALLDEVLSEKTEIPIAKPAEAEKALLLHLEERLHERLINQEEAVRQIADALRRARVDIRAANRPVGTFLFLGPTGVGKTETAKALARLYYGKEERMIRLDMSEFQEVQALGRLIGDVPTQTQGVLTTAIRESPASLVLLDEIEKAHPNILNLFLQVLDDARLTDAWGRTVKFTSCFIICTSNAGSELIREKVVAGSDPATLRAELIDVLQRQGVFRPEFLNRFDGVVIFRTLTEEELTRIAFLLLNDLAERLKEQQITFLPTAELAAEVARKGYSPEFGARAMRRVIQDEIESALAKRILAGVLKQGSALAPKRLTELQ